MGDQIFLNKMLLNFVITGTFIQSFKLMILQSKARSVDILYEYDKFILLIRVLLRLCKRKKYLYLISLSVPWMADTS